MSNSMEWSPVSHPVLIGAYVLVHVWPYDEVYLTGEVVHVEKYREDGYIAVLIDPAEASWYVATYQPGAERSFVCVGEYAALDVNGVGRCLAEYIAEEWAFNGVNAGQEHAIRRSSVENGKAFSLALAAISDGREKLKKEMDATDLAIQKAAFATHGHIPDYATSQRTLKDHARRKELPNVDYIASDYIQQAGIRWIMYSNRIYGQRLSGRQRKALMQTPGGMRSDVFDAAFELLHRLGDFSNERAVWFALSVCVPLAEAIRKATPYAYQKGKQIYFDYKEEMTGERKPYYTHSSDGMMSLVWFLSDARDACTENTSFPNWVRRAIRWHREADEHAREARLEAARHHKHLLEKEVEAADLSILTHPERFTQIRTWRRAEAEGRQMKHCVGTYAREVVEESVLLFHYEEDPADTDTHATVMLSRWGAQWEVAQSYGIENADHDAAKRAKMFIRPLVSHLNRKVRSGQVEAPFFGRATLIL